MKTRSFVGRSLAPNVPAAWRKTLAFLLVAGLAAFAAGSGTNAAVILPAPAPIVVYQGVSVSFEQLDWLGEFPGQVLIPDSRVGVAELHFTSVASSYFVGQGSYVNLTADIGGTKQWSVQNWFVRYPTIAAMVASTPSVQFGMPVANGTPVNSLKFILTITKRPRSDGATLVPNKLAGVASVNYHVGGRNGGGSGLSTLPYTLGPWIGGKVLGGLATPGAETGRRSAGWSYAVSGGGGVSETPNGCGPGSVARAINQMTGDDEQGAYDDLYGKMGTNEETGTSDEDIVNGKNEYCEEHGHDINTELGYLGDDPGLMDDVTNALDSGGAAEALISWDGGGGHAANVTSVTPLEGGGYEITYEDDADQTDGQPANDEHTITTDADGNFDGGTVDGFITETQGGGEAG